jgi:hypothetical protein
MRGKGTVGTEAVKGRVNAICVPVFGSVFPASSASGSYSQGRRRQRHLVSENRHDALFQGAEFRDGIEGPGAKNDAADKYYAGYRNCAMLSRMTVKTKIERAEYAAFADRGEDADDAEIERYLADNHDRIEAKLAEARASIARGEAAPLEPLSVLLREARKQARSDR